MSDAYAMRRFEEAVHDFQALDAKLRESTRSVDPKRIDAVLIDLTAAIPGLEDEDLGRALLFKAYVSHWRYLAELGKKSIFDVINAPVDPRLIEALADARKGRSLVRTPEDIERADATVKQLEEYMR